MEQESQIAVNIYYKRICIIIYKIKSKCMFHSSYIALKDRTPQPQRELNPQSLDLKSDSLSITPPGQMTLCDYAQKYTCPTHL